MSTRHTNLSRVPIMALANGSRMITRDGRQVVMDLARISARSLQLVSAMPRHEIRSMRVWDKQFA
jgi:hypothetical protein